jgi:hypothetical protein
VEDLLLPDACADDKVQWLRASLAIGAAQIKQVNIFHPHFNADDSTLCSRKF